MRLIFVGGCERSGTTLVQKLLASHSRIAGGPELVFTGRIAALYGTMAASYPASYSSRLEAFYDGEELAERFRSFYKGFFRRRFELQEGAVYYSEKTPSNIFAARELLTLFPDSRFVHVIRDGRDVLASHREVRRRFERKGHERYHRATFRPRRVCGRWNRALDLHFELAADRSLDGRYLGLRYEELIRQPETQLRSLFDFLGLELEPRALAPETYSLEEIGIPVDGFWVTEEMDRCGFDERRIGRWKRSLPLAGRLLAGVLMARNLERAGYATAGLARLAAGALPRRPR